MKSDTIANILSTTGGVPQHKRIKDGYEDVGEDFEVCGHSGEDITN